MNVSRSLDMSDLTNMNVSSGMSDPRWYQINIVYLSDHNTIIFALMSLPLLISPWKKSLSKL